MNAPLVRRSSASRGEPSTVRSPYATLELGVWNIQDFGGGPSGRWRYRPKPTTGATDDEISAYNRYKERLHDLGDHLNTLKSDILILLEMKVRANPDTGGTSDWSAVCWIIWGWLRREDCDPSELRTSFMETGELVSARNARKEADADVRRFERQLTKLKGMGKNGTGRMATGRMATGRMATGRMATGRMATGRMATVAGAVAKKRALNRLADAKSRVAKAKKRVAAVEAPQRGEWRRLSAEAAKAAGVYSEGTPRLPTVCDDILDKNFAGLSDDELTQLLSHILDASTLGQRGGREPVLPAHGGMYEGCKSEFSQARAREERERKRKNEAKRKSDPDRAHDLELDLERVGVGARVRKRERERERFPEPVRDADHGGRDHSKHFPVFVSLAQRVLNARDNFISQATELPEGNAHHMLKIAMTRVTGVRSTHWKTTPPRGEQEMIAYICRNGWSCKLIEPHSTRGNTGQAWRRPIYELLCSKGAESIRILAAHAPSPKHINESKDWYLTLNQLANQLSTSTPKIPLYLVGDLNLGAAMQNEAWCREFFKKWYPSWKEHGPILTSVRESGSSGQKWSESYDKVLQWTGGEEPPTYRVEYRTADDARWTSAQDVRQYSDHSFLLWDRFE